MALLGKTLEGLELRQNFENSLKKRVGKSVVRWKGETCALGETDGRLIMSGELVVTESEGRDVASDQENPVDYAATVLGREIESLRQVARGLDAEYGGRKLMKFKDRVSYLTIRSRIANQIVDFTEKLCKLRSPEPVRIPTGGSRSWNPDAVQGAETPQAE